MKYLIYKISGEHAFPACYMITETQLSKVKRRLKYNYEHGHRFKDRYMRLIDYFFEQGHINITRVKLITADSIKEAKVILEEYKQKLDLKHCDECGINYKDENHSEDFLHKRLIKQQRVQL